MKFNYRKNKRISIWVFVFLMHGERVSSLDNKQLKFSCLQEKWQQN